MLPIRTLARMTPEAIYAALTTGAMVQQASKLSADEKRVLAEFFGGRLVSGRLFLGGDNSFIYSLDAATGCVHWSFQSEAQVRTSIVIAPVSGHGSTKYAAYFGDRKANVYAVDARNGELLWKRNAEQRVLAHITGR